MIPLRAIEVFEAAFRHQSFKRAAEELHLTPGAVGQHIQKLETWLGETLFERQTRQIIATPAGRHYYAQVAEAVRQIKTASESLRQQDDHQVTLSVPTTFAYKWLSHHIADFMAKHPDIDVHIHASTRPVDFMSREIDLAIRYFDNRDTTLNSHLLYPDRIRLYCAPAYQQSLPLRHPHDLQRATLLEVELHDYWDAWLSRYANIDLKQTTVRTRHYNQNLMAINAAKEGQGVLLSSPLLVADDVESGDLIEPFPAALPSSRSYYVVHPQVKTLSRAAKALRYWLIETFEATHQAKPEAM